MSYGSPTPAGWYPDPYYPASIRYWDGTAWTSYAQATAMAGAGYSTPGGRLDLADGRKAANRAAKAFVAIGVVNALIALVYPFYFYLLFKPILDGDLGGPGPGMDGRFPLLNIVVQPLGIINIIAVVVVVIWCYRATSNANALGMATTHTPGWAVAGWFVPFLNFVYPYQVMRDLIPADHPMRSKVGLWWGLYLGGGFLLFVPVVLAFVALPLAAVVALVPVGMELYAAWLAQGFVTAIADAQEAAGSGHSGPVFSSG